MGNKHYATLAHQLLRRVVAADKADRFRLADVCPVDSGKYLDALDELVQRGLAERVVERIGVWHYRLSEAGLAAAAAGAIPPHRKPYGGRPSTVDPTPTTTGGGNGPRVNRKPPDTNRPGDRYTHDGE